jgi:hypothetical protein
MEEVEDDVEGDVEVSEEREKELSHDLRKSSFSFSSFIIC